MKTNKHRIWLSEYMLFILENAIEYFELYCKEIEKDGVVVTDKDYFNILKYRIRHNNFYASISDDEAESLLNIIDSMCKALLENGPPFSEDEMHLFKCAERFVNKMGRVGIKKTYENA